MAGADITEFGKPPVKPRLPDLLSEIEDSRKLLVAALHGTALGGGLELALSCHYRCALDSTKVGLPEVKLGLLPGAGGTQRVPRLAGVQAALNLITNGNPIDVKQALEVGLIDEIVEGDLRAAAMAYARELLDARAPIRKSSDLTVEPVSGQVFEDAKTGAAKRARGQHAPQRIIEAVEAAATLPFAHGPAADNSDFLNASRCCVAGKTANFCRLSLGEK